MRYGSGSVAQAGELLGEGYALLTTERTSAAAPNIVAAAGAVHQVPPGRVDEIAAELRGAVDGELVVALGGGRVIDTAKALAAADPPRRAAAIPTTLSGAEMTAVHRHATGVAAETQRVRPAIVINDPELTASQPEPELAASALNALAHAAEAPLTPLANPVSTLSALEGARLIATAFPAAKGDVRREPLALGALLAGFAIDSAAYGMHHVLSQTLVRFAGIAHGQANAIMLTVTLGALRERDRAAIERLDAALGEDATAFAGRIAARTGATRLEQAGVERAALERCADEAAQRAELALTPPAADRAELLALYEAAF